MKKYVNPVKQFTSYFLTFNEGGSRIELMYRPGITEMPGKRGFINGLTHFAIKVASKEKVNEITEGFRKDGYIIAGEPCISGDGYYESAILDPEGNHIGIVA